MSNKIIHHHQKEQIRKLTEERISVEGSQNKYARSKGISEAHISNLMNHKWDIISPEMWKKMADACGWADHSWQIAETGLFKTLRFLIDDARENANVYAAIAPAGSGKSQTAGFIAQNTRNAFWLVCDEFWNKKHFMMELLKAMGRNADGLTSYEMMLDLQSYITKLDRPVIILDEVDKLKDEVLYFFISLYNKLYGRCGIVLCSTDYMAKRLSRGLRLNKKGYQEIYSRIGRKFIELPEVSNVDITLVCRANGVDDKAAIRQIIEESESDLRRVRKLVYKHIKMNAVAEPVEASGVEAGGGHG
jgi:Cdc6-like AAA superfamily ATPase